MFLVLRFSSILWPWTRRQGSPSLNEPSDEGGSPFDSSVYPFSITLITRLSPSKDLKTDFVPFLLVPIPGRCPIPRLSLSSTHRPGTHLSPTCILLHSPVTSPMWYYLYRPVNHDSISRLVCDLFRSQGWWFPVSLSSSLSLREPLHLRELLVHLICGPQNHG